MARGFDSTFGSASTDKISCSSFVTPSAVSISAWYWRNGEGGLSSGRICDKTGTNGVGEFRLFRSGSANISFTRDRTTDSSHNTTASDAVAVGKWIHIIVTQDGSTAAPIFYINGNSVTVNTANAGSGSLTLGSGEYTVGNRGTSGTQWDGMLGDQAVWSTVLTAAEALALFNGADAISIQPQHLKQFVSLRSGLPCSLYGAQPITTGTRIRADRFPANDNTRFPFTKVPVSGINGTASITEANDSSSATATLAIAGVLSSTDANDTAAATGTLLVAGTASITEADDALSSASILAIAATLASTDENDSLAAAGVGSQQNSGSASIIEADDTSAATGTLAIAASAAIVEGDDAATGAGGLLVTGAASITEAADTSAATGAVLIKAALAANDNDDTLVATGAAIVSGNPERKTGSRPTAGPSALRINLSRGARPAAIYGR